MNKTKIEWCDSTWNPVVGCLHKCEYCYARRIAERFKTPGVIVGENVVGMAIDKPFKDKFGRSQAYPFGFIPTLHSYRLEGPQRLKSPRTIFVCSMADLFGDWVADEWIETVFDACAKAPQHRYLFLTKNPARYIELHEKGLLPMGENYWYGSTVTDGEKPMFSAMDFNCFLSIEPILGEFGFLSKHALPDMKWVILGAETGNRKGKVVPERSWIEEVIRWAKASGTAAFMKDSLIPIVGEENMLREFPWEAETVEKVENEDAVAPNKLNCAGASAVE